MDLKTSFTILGIDQQTDQAQAKHAYKAQVRRWHPDQFPEGSSTKVGAEEQLKQINIAYARVKAHLAGVRTNPAETASPPRSSRNPTRSNDMPGKNSGKRSWVDHLFDTLNAFAGHHDDKPDQTPADESRARRKKTFGQVLDEMASRDSSSTPKRRSVHPAAARRTPARYRRCRRRGGAVGGVGSSERPGPIRPVSRVRGIGRNR